MPNFAAVLKAEVMRLARKEVRTETEALKKMVSGQRADLVAVKRRVQELEKALKLVTRGTSQAKAVAEADGAEDGGDKFRFRASGLANNRKRLGLSAADFGLLVGATGQSVYAWEAGKTKPRGQNLAAIAALRGIGRREVATRLSKLKSNR